MKSSTHLLTALVVALATLSQSAIATPSDRMMSHKAIDSYQLSGKQPSLSSKAIAIAVDPPSEAIKNQTSVMPVSFTPKQASPFLKKAIISRILAEYSGIDLEGWDIYKPPFSFTEIDLNNDGKKETIVLDRKGARCNNRSCAVEIFKLNGKRKSYDFVSRIGTSRGWLEVAVLPTKSHGWQDLAVRYFSYETRTVDWYPVKFDGRKYESLFQLSQRLKQEPKNIILSEKSPVFDLGEFPSMSAIVRSYKDSPSTVTKTYRMKTGDFIRCVGAEDDLKISQKINFRGKGFNRFINHTTTLKCTMMEITNISNTALTRTIEKKHAVLYCPKGMSYQANFLSIEKYRDTFTIGCDIPKQYFSL